MILDIDPKVDYAFKHLFGRDETRSILIDVIDSVLNPDPAHRIRDIELQNPFNPKETLDDKLSILDIKARDQNGRQFNVEMQMLAFPYYEKRILYYWAKLHQQQLKEGHEYRELKPTISISFLDHVLFPQVADHHLRFRLLEEARHFPCTEDIAFHVLELPKFTKTADELTTSLDIWLYFLRHAAKMDTEALPAALQQPLVRRALEELKMMTQSEIERERYEARRKAQLDYNTITNVARDEGHAKGLAEGRAEGHAEGRTEGRAEGEKLGLIRLIHLCERLLGRAQTPAEHLANRPLEDLTRLADDLQVEMGK
jgi:predicted transposase/invertase (TIGR01784 family)